MSEVDVSKLQYYWSPTSSESIDEFLNKYKPSMVQCKGEGSEWIWVAGPGAKLDTPEKSEGREKAVAQASLAFATLKKRLEEIHNDPTKYPIRAKKGVQSAKAARDEAGQIAIESIKAIANENGYTEGKWMFFAQSEQVDRLFATIAKSVAEGPLSKDGDVKLCKAATWDASQSERGQVICLYMDNIWDIDSSKRVLKTLAQKHGLIPSSAKPDLYTVVGISGGVKESGMASSIGNPAKFMQDEGGQATLIAMVDEYKKVNKKPSGVGGNVIGREDDGPSAKTGEKRSTDESTEPAAKKKRIEVKKSVKQVEKENDIFGGGSDSD